MSDSDNQPADDQSQQQQQQDGGGAVKHRMITEGLVKFIAERGYAFDGAGNIRTVNGWTISDTNIPDIAQDFAYLQRFRADVTVSYLTETLETLARRSKAARRKAIAGAILSGTAQANQAGMVELRNWLRALTGRDNETDYTVMRHWLWLVKRGLADLAPLYHVMPILSGKQGGGKSTAIRLLLGCLQELYLMPCDAGILTDEKRTPALATYAVAVLDEMQGVNKADAESIKQTITAETKSYRPMRTNSIATVPVRCRFLGATNEPVQGLINDTTGARRFFEIPCLDVVNQDAINGIDYRVLWTGVSETEAPPFTAEVTSIAVRQADLVKTDSVSEWLESETWEVTPDILGADSLSDPYWLPAMAVRKLYERFCRAVAEPVMGLSAWGRRLHSCGLVAVRRREGGEKTRWYCIQPIGQAKMVEKRF